MEIKREPKIKSMKYEDFNDNEYLEKMVAELRDKAKLTLVSSTSIVEGGSHDVILRNKFNSRE